MRKSNAGTPALVVGGESKGTESPAVRGSKIDCKVLREDGHDTAASGQQEPSQRRPWWRAFFFEPS
jgi:hypothetical protein